MAKTRMNNGHRDLLRDFAYKKIEEIVDRSRQEKLYSQLLIYTNHSIRKKYPEEHMVILRKYKLNSHDSCVKFVFPSGGVNAFQAKWHWNKPEGDNKYDIVDIPFRAGCSNQDVYQAPAKIEEMLDEYEKAISDSKKLIDKKKSNISSLLNFAKYIEDVLEVLKVPPQLEAKLLAKSTALVALSPDVIASIQADFSA